MNYKTSKSAKKETFIKLLKERLEELGLLIYSVY
jgi:hypothetical protein